MDNLESVFLNGRTLINRCMDGDVNMKEWLLVCNAQVTMMVIIIGFWIGVYIAVKFIDDLKNEFIKRTEADQ